MPQRRENQDTHPARQVIRTRINYLRDIPHPRETYTAYEAPKGVRKKRRWFRTHGIIHKTGTEDTKHASNQYQTDQRAYDAIQDELKQRDLLPCGHTGLANPRGEGFACNYEYCEERFSRETVEGLEL